MAPLKSGVLMICVIINVAHAGFYEDLNMCINQLQFAFQLKSDSAAAGLKHSIKYYVKGQRIAVSSDTQSDENQSIVSGSQSDADIFEPWMQDELINETIFEFGDTSDVNDDVESNSDYDFDSSQYGLDYLEDFEKWLEERNLTENEGQQDIEGSSQSVSSSSRSVFIQQDSPLNYAELYHIELEKMITGRHVFNRIKFCQFFFGGNLANCFKALEPFGDVPLKAVQLAFSNYTLHECDRLNDTATVVKAVKVLFLMEDDTATVVKAVKVLFLMEESSDPNYGYIKKYIETISVQCRAVRTIKPRQFCEKIILAKYNLTEKPNLG